MEITILNQLGIHLAEIIRTLFIMGVLCILFVRYAWPHLMKFFRNISDLKDTVKDLQKSVDATNGQAKEAKDAIVKMQKSVDTLSHTLQEHMVQTDVRMQQGEDRFSQLDKRLSILESKTNH